MNKERQSHGDVVDCACMCLGVVCKSVPSVPSIRGPGYKNSVSEQAGKAKPGKQSPESKTNKLQQESTVAAV